VGEVLLEVERARSCSLPSRRFARNRLVAGELGLEDALSAGQAGELTAEVLEP
jgi:hypothetical protein